MIRILQVFSAMNRGGSETMIMNYYRSIDRSKIQFDFVVHTNKDATYDNEIERLGGKIFHMPFFRGYNLFSYQKVWRNFFRSHPEYNIIHVHYYTIAGVILPIAKQYKIAVRIIHSHNAKNSIHLLRYLRFYILRPFAIRNATDRFACGKDAGLFFFGEKDFIIMKNAIDAENFKFSSSLRIEIRNNLGLENKFVVGHIGRFVPQKNHTFIIDVFKKVSELTENAMLFLVGDGPLLQEIKDKVRRLVLQDKVIFAGVRSDIPEILQAIDVLLFPSLFEGLPVTFVEAQAAGIKIVASDIITKEINITDLIQNCSLKEHLTVWANAVNRYAEGYFREDTFKQIEKAGYDIKSNAEWLQNFYMNKLNG